MPVTNMSPGVSNGLTWKMRENNLVRRMGRSIGPPGCWTGVRNNLTSVSRREVKSLNCVKLCHQFSGDHTRLFSLTMRPGKKCTHPIVYSQVSGYGADPYNVEEIPSTEGEHDRTSLEEENFELMGTPTGHSGSENVKHELVRLSLPAMAGQVFEPLAQLMETAYIGRLGPMELASAAVSISIFNVISKLFNIPLLSVATSFVAEDISKNESKESPSDGILQNGNSNGKPLNQVTERKQLASVSTALLLASGIGLFEAVALYFGSGVFLQLMGVPSASPMRAPAQQFLSLRALGAPAAVLSLALQGIFRGFKDTKTPLICLGVGSLSAAVLFPLLMYAFRLGVIGAGIATVLSQYIVTFLMVWYLNKRAVLLPPKMGSLQFGGYLKSGGFLFGRTLAVLVTMTLATRMAASQGPYGMAAHQICLQVWLAVSLITDAIATSGQAMIATSFSKGDYSTVKEITYFILKTGLFAGVSLAMILGASFGSLATVFTKDTEVLRIVRSGILFVSASQPINALAFVFDGLHYGVSDFAYAASSMMVIGAISSIFLLYAPSIYGLSGVWMGLVLLMGLRMVAGCMRLMSKSGPWWFLHKDV